MPLSPLTKIEDDGQAHDSAARVEKRRAKGKERAKDEDECMVWGDEERTSTVKNEAGREGQTSGNGVAMDVDDREDEKPFSMLAASSSAATVAAAFPTPALTPLASTSTSFAFPASPTGPSSANAPLPVPPLPTPSTSQAAAILPPSPSRQPRRRLIPLDRLFPAGTVLLPDHVLAPGNELMAAEDGWIALDKETLQAADLAPLSPIENDSSATLPTPSASPRAGRKPASKKRKASSSARGSPTKRARASAHPLLDSLVWLSAALAVRATVRVVGTTAVVRVYLVPQDLPEMADADHRRGALKRPAGSTVFGLLNAVRMSPEEWSGEVQSEAVPLFMSETDTRSLLEVYTDIESPSHDPTFVDELDANEEVKERLRWAVLDGAEGVQTDMFAYQKATLAKMLARELAPQDIPQPSFLRYSSFLDPSHPVYISLEGGIRLAPGTVKEPSGGILAEDMGVGKTLITLSLVLSTLNELPKLDGVSTYEDGSAPSPAPVLLTAFSQQFPFAAEIAEAKKLRPRVPELLAGYMMEAREELEYHAALAKQAEEDARIATFPLPSLRSLMVHHIKSSPTAIRYPLDDPRLSGTELLSDLQNSPPFYRVFPSPAQLDSREGRKGRFKPEDKVVAATTLIVVPTDLVRQWVDEIERHIEPGALRYLVLRTAKDKFPSAAVIATYDLVLMSVARFSDAADSSGTAASLRSIHWRRLVVDEGHALHAANRMRKLAEDLRCESRWAVSGTPSTNLRVAQDGQDSALFAPATAAGGDRVDLDRLGQLFSRFLKHPAFPKHDSLRKTVQAHVLGGGDRTYRLANVLSRAVVRHHPSLVKESVILPPLTSRVVYVEMEEGERKVYNALVALFASNSATSQRVDQDYLFHPRNAKHLASLCANLAVSTSFFGSSEFRWQLQEASDYARKRLSGPSVLKWTAEERQTLKKALEVFQEALDDREAQLTASEPGVAFEVEGLNDDLRSTFFGLSAEHNPRKRVMITSSQLVRLRVDLKELRREDVKAWDDDEELVEELITFEEKRKRLDAAPAGQAPETDEPPLFKKRSKKDMTPVAPLPEDSTFKDIKLIRTTSSKINYIVSELRRHPDDKFIIFSSSIVDIVFANLSETLDLVGIKHAIFAGSQAHSSDRGLTAQRFNAATPAECQAILVDANLGGRGITLTGANRIIFVEAIWKPDLERQAQKRAHRLGQTKPVDLQVLVVKATYEDALLQRRAELAPEDFVKKTKLPQQDSHLRSLLQSAQYLEPGSEKAKRCEPVSERLQPAVRLIRE
ncbi:hypothetical protein JCM10213_005656 [Rhodosporidiobolus nylandii]